MKTGYLKKRICILFVSVLCMAGLFGCKKTVETAAVKETESSIQDIAVNTEIPEIITTPEPTATPVPTPEIPISTADPYIESEKLSRITEDVIVFQNENIRLEDYIYINSGLSSLEDQLKKNAEWAEKILQEMDNIDREALKEADQIDYDTIRIFLKNIIRFSDSSLGNYLLQRNEYGYLKLPLVLYYYSLENKSDIEKYIELISLSENYVISYGKLMSDYETGDWTRSEIQREAELFSGKKFRKLLSEKIEKQIQSCSDIERQEKKTYIKEIKKLLDDVFAPAIRKLLSDGGTAESPDMLQDSKNETVTENTAAALTQSVTGGIETDEVTALLENTAQKLLSVIQSIQDSNKKLNVDKLRFDKYNAEKSIQKGKKATEEFFDTRIKNRTEICISDPLLTEVTAYAYVSSFQNDCIWINSKTPPKNMYFEAAGAGYPGCLYLRGIQSQSTRKFLTNTAAYERGWSRYCTETLLLHQNDYPAEEALLFYDSETLYNYIIPSLVYLYANDGTVTGKDVKRRITPYLENTENSFDTEKDMSSIESNVFTEAVGYALLSKMFEDMSAVLGDRYVEKDVINMYLSYGPSYYTVLRDRMDTWASEQSSY